MSLAQPSSMEEGEERALFEQLVELSGLGPVEALQQLMATTGLREVSANELELAMACCAAPPGQGHSNGQLRWDAFKSYRRWLCESDEAVLAAFTAEEEAVGGAGALGVETLRAVGDRLCLLQGLPAEQMLGPAQVEGLEEVAAAAGGSGALDQWEFCRWWADRAAVVQLAKQLLAAEDPATVYARELFSLVARQERAQHSGEAREAGEAMGLQRPGVAALAGMMGVAVFDHEAEPASVRLTAPPMPTDGLEPLESPIGFELFLRWYGRLQQQEAGLREAFSRADRRKTGLLTTAEAFELLQQLSGADDMAIMGSPLSVMSGGSHGSAGGVAAALDSREITAAVADMAEYTQRLRQIEAEIDDGQRRAQRGEISFVGFRFWATAAVGSEPMPSRPASAAEAEVRAEPMLPELPVHELRQPQFMRLFAEKDARAAAASVYGGSAGPPSPPVVSPAACAVSGRAGTRGEWCVPRYTAVSQLC